MTTRQEFFIILPGSIFMNQLATAVHELSIEIGGMPILVRTESADFMRLLEERYGGFVAAGENGNGKLSEIRPADGEIRKSKPENRISKIDDGTFVNRKSKIENRESSAPPVFSLDVELLPPGPVSDVEDVRVRLECGRWLMERGDFRAGWDPERRRGWVRQTAHPYAIDSVLRILHTLLLARQGGFLVHAASAIRDGRAFLLAGPSGAGKTTLARLAPPDVALLTDEVSYVRAKEELQESEVRSQELEARSEEGGGRRQEAGVRSPSRVPRVPSAVSRIPNPEPRAPAFEAFGTPFAGELARLGENLRAPVGALYFLAQGRENRIEPVREADAVRALLQNILFFAEDAELVRLVFESAFDFVSRVPVRRLVFAPDARVWELIGTVASG